MRSWRSYLAISVFGLLGASAFAQQGAAKPSSAEEATVLEQIRERIVWYDQERTRPLLILQGALGLVPYDQLPIPERAIQSIRMSLSLRREWKSRWGEPYPDCSYAEFFERGEFAPEERSTVQEVVAAGPVVLLVSIEATTLGYQPFDMAIYQFNEFSILDVLVGRHFPHQDPLSSRAFLSQGGEIVVDGTRLCTLSPWHDEPPRRKDQYLLVGAPDDKGIFHANFYFRIEKGRVLPANYSSLKVEGPILLDRILSTLNPAREVAPNEPQHRPSGAGTVPGSR